MEYYARINGEDKQLLKDHINGVFVNSTSMQIEGLLATSQLLAKLHDLGKYHQDWQRYLLESSECNSEKIPHAPYGARFVKDNSENNAISLENIFAKDILQFVVLAHHGLFDCMTLKGNQSLEDREKMFADKYLEGYTKILESYFKEHNQLELRDLINHSYQELETIFRKTIVLDKKKYNLFFAHGVVMRMLLSILIDSDWSDAANFSGSMEKELKNLRDSFGWEEIEKTLTESINGFKIDSKIGELRSKISSESMSNHVLDSGIYRLQVPTGGGKTLSVMRFALAHARKHGKDRIIYTAPFKSIIDQTAEVYRKHLIDENNESYSDWLILEHHGDVIRDKEEYALHSEDGDIKDVEENNRIRDYLTDNWSSPIILTTLVQLLNTMLSSNKRSIRRCHRLYNSVLIIDEFQSVPVRSKTLFHSWLNVLSKLFKVTVILCTATQPPLMETIFDDRTKYGIQSIDYSKPMDLVRDYYEEATFKRTKVVNNTKDKPFSIEEIGSLIESRMAEIDSLLVILNTREAVRKLSKQMSTKGLNNSTYYLSNNMSPAHRKAKIKEIIYRLDKKRNNYGLEVDNEKILVISTSLIEAGVNISFEEVIRSLSGLDSISQSAGRCNRNGESDLGLVRIINPSEEVENVSRMEEVILAQEVMIPILNDFENRAEAYDNDLMSHKAMYTYFLRYYEKIAKMTHYPVNLDGLETSLYQLLSGNRDFCNKYAHVNKNKILNRVLNQAFLTAGEVYEPIEDKSIRVLTQWGTGKEIAVNLGRDVGFDEKAKLLKKAEQYSVGVYEHRFQNLRENGAIYTIGEGEVWILQSKYYDDSVGLVMDPTELGLKNETISI